MADAPLIAGLRARIVIAGMWTVTGPVVDPMREIATGAQLCRPTGMQWMETLL